MKAILEFDLPEDKFEFEIATTASKWVFAMWEFDQHLRSEMKYNSHDWSDEKYETYEKLREKLLGGLTEKGISFDMID
jgi:hypothetical protein